MVMLLLTFQLNAQQVTWQCSNVIVENPPAFVSVWNDFMESDLESLCHLTLSFSLTTQAQSFHRLIRFVSF